MQRFKSKNQIAAIKLHKNAPISNGIMKETSVHFQDFVS